MKAFVCFVLGFLGTIASIIPQTGVAEVSYLDTKAIRIQEVLPAPSAVGSPETVREIDFMRERQLSRTPQEVDRALSEETFSPFLFRNVVGPWFTRKNLPETSELLDEVSLETRIVYRQVKAVWNRPRPPLQDMRLHPSLPLPKGTSYPSGHATRSVVVARILAELAPDLREPLDARAKQIGDDRWIACVHFPSDVEAGRKLGDYLFEQFEQSPAFQAQLAKAKAEFARVRPEKNLRGSKGG